MQEILHLRPLCLLNYDEDGFRVFNRPLTVMALEEHNRGASYDKYLTISEGQSLYLVSNLYKIR